MLGQSGTATYRTSSSSRTQQSRPGQTGLYSATWPAAVRGKPPRNWTIILPWRGPCSTASGLQTQLAWRAGARHRSRQISVQKAGMRISRATAGPTTSNQISVDGSKARSRSTAAQPHQYGSQPRQAEDDQGWQPDRPQSSPDLSPTMGSKNIAAPNKIVNGRETNGNCTT